MEASDRGLLDIERFDLDRNYPIMHGKVKREFLLVDEFTPEQKKQLPFMFVDPIKASERGLLSFKEIGKTITTWPQLASDVLLGGSVVCMTSRMILLKQNVNSKRIYVDIPSIVNPKDNKFPLMRKLKLLYECFKKVKA